MIGKLLLSVSILMACSVAYAQTYTGQSSNDNLDDEAKPETPFDQAEQLYPGTLGKQLNNNAKSPQTMTHRFIGEPQRFQQYGQVTNRQNPWTRNPQARPTQVLPPQGADRQNPWQINRGMQDSSTNQNNASFPFMPEQQPRAATYNQPYRNYQQYGQGFMGSPGAGYGQPSFDGFWPNMNGFGGNGSNLPFFPMGMF